MSERRFLIEDKTASHIPAQGFIIPFKKSCLTPMQLHVEDRQREQGLMSRTCLCRLLLTAVRCRVRNGRRHSTAVQRVQVKDQHRFSGSKHINPRHINTTSEGCSYSVKSKLKLTAFHNSLLVSEWPNLDSFETSHTQTAVLLLHLSTTTCPQFSILPLAKVAQSTTPKADISIKAGSAF